MTNNQNEDIYTGFNDLKQVEMSITAAEKMVGSATMSMDEEFLLNATRAVQDARTQLANAVEHQTGVDSEFLQLSEATLSRCEQQLLQAKQ